MRVADFAMDQDLDPRRLAVVFGGAFLLTHTGIWLALVAIGATLSRQPPCALKTLIVRSPPSVPVGAGHSCPESPSPWIYQNHHVTSKGGTSLLFFFHTPTDQRIWTSIRSCSSTIWHENAPKTLRGAVVTAQHFLGCQLMACRVVQP